MGERGGCEAMRGLRARCVSPPPQMHQRMAGRSPQPHLVDGQAHGVAEGLQQRGARGAGGHGAAAAPRSPAG